MFYERSQPTSLSMTKTNAHSSQTAHPLVTASRHLADELEYHEESWNGRAAKDIGGECVERDDAMLIFSHPALEAALNFACRIRSDDAHIEELIDNACAWFDARHVAPQFRISPLTRPSNVERILEEIGFECNERETQMVLQGKDRLRPSNPRVQVERASSNTLEKFVEIQDRAFGGTIISSSKILEMVRAAFESHVSIPYMARIDGEWVGAGSLTQWAGVFGIYGVATAEKVRGQGVATALMRRMIGDVRVHSDAPICLQVETGTRTQRWYEQMGFGVAYDRTGWTRR